MALLTGFRQKFITLADGKVVGIHEVELPDTSAHEIAVPPLLISDAAAVALSSTTVTATPNAGSNSRRLGLQTTVAGGEKVTVLTLHGKIGSFDA